ncbi:MAG: nucleotidyltransferase family protein [Desulfurococcales archaeon]|nr:nucleotidyltransferase family protein [Desulfurococcales archaeon]
MKAAIIAGGLGRRLRPITEEIPKALVPIAGKPIIAWQIEWLKRFGLDTVVVLGGYLHEKIIQYLGSGSKFGVRVVYSVEDKPLGTAGALKNAEGVLKDDVFVALNGDVLTNLDLGKVVDNVRRNKDILIGMALVPLKSPYGVVEIDEEGKVRNFREKPILHEYLINAGIYVMKPEVFNYVPEEGDLEKTTFPTLARSGRVTGIPFKDVFWRSVDTVKDVQEVSKEIVKYFS